MNMGSMGSKARQGTHTPIQGTRVSGRENTHAAGDVERGGAMRRVGGAEACWGLYGWVLVGWGGMV